MGIDLKSVGYHADAATTQAVAALLAQRGDAASIARAIDAVTRRF